ncbi:MAG TPA: sigma-54 dependent transcriptional regulator [Thermodesulfovibrionia bacterium]|nr:sigma-54 dependent transcriptional regulator [Thermodesulfovibrionia bacterium]
MDKIIVVDDDQNILKVIKLRLESKGFQISAVTNSKKAVDMVKNDSFDLAIVDLKLVRENGITLMEDIHQISPELPIIILTAYGTIQNAVFAMKKGAYSYLTKPFDHKELLLQIKNGLRKNKLDKEVKRLTGLVKDKYCFDNIIVKSDKMEAVMEQVAQVAETDSIVCIGGESGTGKELIARALHVASARKDGPFVAINCAAIPDGLLESELFGYEKGAFTGAFQKKRGLLMQAHRGTFFMDEVSEMSLKMQTKLLRVIQERTCYPLGAERAVQFDVRFIVASNRNLAEEVGKGNFRADLYYRVHVIPINIPPLRDRKESIPYLTNHFLEIYSKKMQKEIKGFSQGAIQKLMTYSWPGNVRELENAVECAVVMADQDVITEDLVLKFNCSNEARMKNLKDAKEDFEKNYIVQILELTYGNVSEAAKLAGKYRADLYDLLKKYNINPAEFR